MLIIVSLIFERNILISQLPQNSHSIFDITVKEEFKEQAKLAYIDFLKKFSKTETYQVYEFSLRDFDKDGIPELIIVQSNAVHGILSVYYYDGDLKNMEIILIRKLDNLHCVFLIIRHFLDYLHFGGAEA